MAKEYSDDHKKRLSKERAAGKKAALALQTKVRHLIAVETVQQTGELLRTNVKPYVNKETGLMKLYINGPHYGYKLNFGFIGIRSGHQLKLVETAHISDAIEKTSIVDKLATEIGEIRADQLIARIKF